MNPLFFLRRGHTSGEDDGAFIEKSLRSTSVPLEDSPLSFIGPCVSRPHQSQVVIGYTLLVMVMAMALAFVAFTLYAAKSRVVRNSQPLFLYLLAMGCVINALTIIPLSKKVRASKTTVENSVDF